MSQTALSTTSSQSTTTPQRAIELYDLGYCVVPLVIAEKRPAVKWAHYQIERPPRQTVVQWFTQWPNYGIGIITGEVSGIMCLDYDKEPYPDNDHAFINTRRGRHYYYRFSPGDLHGLQVQSGVDIPRLAKYYEPFIVNESRIPLQPSYQPRPAGSTGAWDDANPPEFDLITNCDFIQWFRERRQDPRWDGRYPLARAYASNVLRTRNADTDLGPGYQHTTAILASTTRPISCRAISEHWPCPRMDAAGFCTKAPGISTPYGLAKRKQ